VTARRDDLEPTVLHRSLLTPVLVLGAERRAVGPLLGLAGGLIFGFGLNLVTPAAGVGLLLVGLPLLRRLARRDPWAVQVLARHFAVAGFYPAQARHDQPRRRRPTF
jgi:type IV secretory pathway TrbD component